MDIHFTDEHGNEFFIRIDEQVQVWKNKTQIEDVRFYPDEIETNEN
jgi:hypothetical protein